jgi:hypothetical protein
MEFGLERFLLGKLLALGFQLGDALAQPGEPGLELVFFQEPLGITVNQPCYALTELPQLRFQRRVLLTPGLTIWGQSALVFLRDPFGVGQQCTDFPPYSQIQEVRPDLGILTDALTAKTIRISAQTPIIGIRARFTLPRAWAEAFPIEGIAAVLTLG